MCVIREYIESDGAVVGNFGVQGSNWGRDMVVDIM